MVITVTIISVITALGVIYAASVEQRLQKLERKLALEFEMVDGKPTLRLDTKE